MPHPTPRLWAVALLALVALPAAAQATFSNPAAITLAATAPPNPGSVYPSAITVAGTSGTITDVNVTLTSVSHTFPNDLDVLLVGPGGQAFVLMSDVGGSPNQVGTTWTFDDQAATLFPDVFPGATTDNRTDSGSYRPSDVTAGDTWPSPAPAAPYASPAPVGTATLNGTFGGGTANGTWRLYVTDDADQDGGSIAGGWSITFGGVTSGQIPLVISEFRLRGSNGASDEFVEILNASGSPHTVAGGGTGYAIAASNGVARCVIPNGTVIPARGHYLCANSVGYSLAGYATADATFTTDIPDNVGIALFNTSVASSFTLASRIDAVGSTSEANTLYKEGAGYPALTPFSIDYAFARDACGKRGSITAAGACQAGGTVVDTDDNAVDFVFVDTNGTSGGAGQRLGAPGPENLASPTANRPDLNLVTPAALDVCTGAGAAPNRVRDATSDPANNSTFGTLDIRRTFTNTTGVPLTRLRFRIVDLTTFPAPSGFADLRPRTSANAVVTVDRTPCGTGTSNVTVRGTTLEQPPVQPNGSGFNGSLSVGSVTAATPLAAGASVDVRFLLGIQQTGNYRFGIVAETLPGGSSYMSVEGNTENVVAGEDEEARSVALDAVRPNPATGSGAEVRFSLGEAADARVEVFDMLGRRVAVLAEGALAAGPHAARLDTSDLPAGAYVVRLAAGGQVLTRRLTVVR